MPSFKTLATVFGSTCLLLSPLNVTSCWFDPAWDYQGYNLFLQEVAELPDYEPLYFSFERYYGETNENGFAWDTPQSRNRDNIADWVAYFGGKFTAAQVDSLVYGSMAGFERDKRNFPTPVVEYITFARECEPLVALNFGIEWWQERQAPNENQMTTLMQEAVSAAKSTSDTFLRRRYAFQAIRLAHYSNNTELCAHLFDELFGGDTQPSLARWWAMGHKAGALSAQQLLPDAMSLYADVFAHCPSRRIQMYQSFQWAIAEDTAGAAFEQAKVMAKNNDQKAALHLLRAFHPKANGIEEMRAIAALNPASDYMTLLLVREMAKVEQALMGYDFDYRFPVTEGAATGRWEENPEDRKAGLQHLAALQTFIREQLKNGKLAKPQTWQLSDGYLSYLNNDTKTARATLTAIANPTGNIAAQRDVFLFAIDLAELKRVDAATENTFFNRFNALSFKNEYLKGNALSALRHTFARLYEQQIDPARAYFCLNTFEGELIYKPEKEIVLAMREWLQTRSRSSFDQYLRNQVQDGIDPLFVTNEMYGTLLLAEGKFEEAQQVFQELSPASLKDYTRYSVVGEPFELHMNDCHECAQQKGVFMLKFDFARRAAELSRDAQSNTVSPEGRAAALFALGNMWYNTSYFGKSWAAMTYYRASSDGQTKRDTAQLQQAQQAYEQAIQLSKNKELKAKAQFGIAKCQRALVEESALSSTYALLKKDHKSSAFFKEALKECSYLNIYNKTGKTIFPEYEY